MIAYSIGEGIRTAMALYRKVKPQRSRIRPLCTEANSCDEVAFARHQLPEPHIVTKAQTHLIESFNRSIRVNLARFNRRSKRYSKSWQMLRITLDLFFFSKQQSAWNLKCAI